MDSLNTFEGSNSTLDPLYAKQKEDVAKMRSSLLACSDADSSTRAMKNIAVLRVYHQISRIIRYLDLMDKLENKLYRCIDGVIDEATPGDYFMLEKLLVIQERLQKSMIESNKLLQPYMDMDQFKDMYIETESASVPNDIQIMDSASRQKIRDTAQSVLLQLDVR